MLTAVPSRPNQLAVFRATSSRVDHRDLGRIAHQPDEFARGVKADEVAPSITIQCSLCRREAAEAARNLVIVRWICV
jgi:hypothetical protein